MGRKTTLAWLRAGVSAAVWMTAAWLVQGAAGSEIGGTVQRHGERIELHLRGRGEKAPLRTPPPTPPARQQPHEETIQPWERVSV